MSYRAEIAAMLRDMPSGWRRQYRVGRETLARNGGPVLPEAYVRAAWWVSEIGWLRAEQA